MKTMQVFEGLPNARTFHVYSTSPKHVRHETYDKYCRTIVSNSLFKTKTTRVKLKRLTGKVTAVSIFIGSGVVERRWLRPKVKFTTQTFTVEGGLAQLEDILNIWIVKISTKVLAVPLDRMAAPKTEDMLNIWILQICTKVPAVPL